MGFINPLVASKAFLLSTTYLGNMEPWTTYCETQKVHHSPTTGNVHVLVVAAIAAIPLRIDTITCMCCQPKCLNSSLSAI